MTEQEACGCVGMHEVGCPYAQHGREAEARRVIERLWDEGRAMQAVGDPGRLGLALLEAADLLGSLSKAKQRLAAAESGDSLKISQAYGDQLGAEAYDKGYAEAQRDFKELVQAEVVRRQNAEAQVRDLREALETIGPLHHVMATNLPGETEHEDGCAECVRLAALQATQEDGA